MQRLETERDFNRLCMNSFGKIIVLLFHAEWHEHSQEYLSNIEDLIELSDFDSSKIVFTHLDAELVPEVAKKYNINNIPSVVFTDAQKEELKKCENELPAVLVEQIESFMQDYFKKFEEKRVQMYKKIETLINDSPVLIFIKGTATEPECKFTRQFLEIIKELECRFTYYDILADNDMRHWLRHYNKWPTYPQIYINKELIGGLDVTKKLIAEGTLQQKIPQAARIHDPESRFNKIITENKVVLFLQGLPTDQDLSQQQKEVIQNISQIGVKFNCFNALSDPILNEYLIKKFGQENFPIIISDKKNVGNFQQIQQLKAEDKLLEQFPGSEWDLDGEQKLKYLLKQCPVIAFINGIPKDTHNEESKSLINILNELNVVFEFYNVDAEDELRNNLIKISKYEKTPQLYIKGQLIGGIEAVQKLKVDGDLQELVKDYLKQ